MNHFLGQLAIPTIANCNLNASFVQFNSGSDISFEFLTAVTLLLLAISFFLLFKVFTVYMNSFVHDLE